MRGSGIMPKHGFGVARHRRSMRRYLGYYAIKGIMLGVCGRSENGRKEGGRWRKGKEKQYIARAPRLKEMENCRHPWETEKLTNEDGSV